MCLDTNHKDLELLPIPRIPTSFILSLSFSHSSIINHVNHTHSPISSLLILLPRSSLYTLYFAISSGGCVSDCTFSFLFSSFLLFSSRMCPFFPFLIGATRRGLFSLWIFSFSLSPDCICFFLECTNNETFFLRILMSGLIGG